MALTQVCQLINYAMAALCLGSMQSRLADEGIAAPGEWVGFLASAVAICIEMMGFALKLLICF